MQFHRFQRIRQPRHGSDREGGLDVPVLERGLRRERLVAEAAELVSVAEAAQASGEESWSGEGRRNRNAGAISCGLPTRASPLE